MAAINLYSEPEEIHLTPAMRHLDAQATQHGGYMEEDT
jgi:hypothetical protein